MNALSNQYRVIDIDTHVVEPYDLWTSRLSAQKYGDKIPQVRRDPEVGKDFWYFGDKKGTGGASAAQAGWKDYPPNHSPSIDLVDPATWDAHKRLKLMDDYGIYAQVLFPNVVFFGAEKLVGLNDDALMLDVVRAYNDWQAEWSSADPKRYLPQAALPFWDIELALAELERVAKLGHRGIVFTSEPEHFGQPRLTSPHWDRLWAAVQEMEMPVNFHIGSGDMSTRDMMDPSVGEHANYASMGVIFFMGNAKAISQIICGGICHRFPKLNFISVESGVGWLPFALASLDWQWLNCGVPQEHPEYDLLPSEYFRRQIYGSFWFEQQETIIPSIAALGADNILYETDFPHPTSMSPGPATHAQRPADYIEDVFRGVPQDQVQKILHDNAARLYKID
jgi:predicted TIM-barrel fold metal-dependent hydrolase